MKDDYDLFPESAGHDAPLEGDIALITAYLAQELSLVQVAAVEERLVTDAAFRENVAPIVEGWLVPSATRVALAPLATPAEVDIGWQRYQAIGTTVANVVPSLPRVGTAAARRPRRSMWRIAAVIAAIVLPIVTVAQVAIYAARHRLEQSGVPDAMQPSSGDMAEGRGLTALERQAQQSVPVVDVPAPTAATPPLGAILGIKEVSDGRVIVNDAKNHQIRLFAANLASSEILLDSIPGSATSYGPPPSVTVPIPLIPYVGDSSLFPNTPVGPVPGVMHVLDGRGHIVREMALFAADAGTREAPKPTTGSGDSFRFRPVYADNQGRLLSQAELAGVSTVRVPPMVPQARFSPSIVAGGRGGANAGDNLVAVSYRDRPDTVPVLRFDYATRRYDTAGYVRSPVLDAATSRLGLPGRGLEGGGRIVVSFDKNGQATSARQLINPVVVFDDWTVLSDGTIAFVRGQDYHVDWVRPDGSRSASPKLPFEWKRLDDAAKQRLIDSIHTSIDSVENNITADQKCRQHQIDSLHAANGDSPAATALYRDLRNRGVLPAPARFCGDTVVRYIMIPEGGRGGAPAGSQRDVVVPGTPPLPPDWTDTRPVTLGSPRQIPYAFAPLSEIPDYYPAINPRAALADRDGNLWILPRATSLSKKGELVYDVVSPAQGLVKRVRLPLGRSIAGFGRNGVIYLQYGSVKTGFVLERVKLPN